jgi:hypothetical protein
MNEQVAPADGVNVNTAPMEGVQAADATVLGGEPDPAPTLTGWRADLPEGLRDEPSLSTIPDVEALAKSFVNTKKLVGADVIKRPNKYATKEDWDSFYSEIGRPEAADKYDVKLGEGATVDDGFLDWYKEKVAFDMGLLPHQAQGILDLYLQRVHEDQAEYEQQVERDTQETIQSLQKEWGGAYDGKVAQANHALEMFGGDETMSYVRESGLGRNVEFIKLMAKVGENMTEDNFRAESIHRQMGPTPGEAQKEITQIMSDANHPYFDKLHPQHKFAVDEMQKLFQAAYPEGA